VILNSNYFSNFTKSPLIILDVANNHSGSVEHGKKIINEVSRVSNKFSFKVAVKFQYRHLDSFIHPKYKSREDLPIIKRFESTKLNDQQFLELKKYSEDLGLITACTPFDEISVEKVLEHKYEVVKIASASIEDWPLLEALVKNNKQQSPVIASTGGITLNKLDRVSQFLSKRMQSFALMHCVGKYPTLENDLQLKRIAKMAQRYSGIPIGYSTHEDPKNLSASIIALGMGATIFERHVGFDSETFRLNKYSSGPNELENWFSNLSRAITMMGDRDFLHELDHEEVESLRVFKRGVFVKGPIQRGQKLDNKNLYFAIPLGDDQLSTQDLSKSQKLISKRLFSNINEPISRDEVFVDSTQDKILEIAGKVQALFRESFIALPPSGTLEISHHHGLDNFNQYGASLITIVNREYCKKIIAVFQNQENPEHFHKRKEETFICLKGIVEVVLDGVAHILRPGESLLVKPGVKHKFLGLEDSVLEEISTNHLVGDSFYSDDSIMQNLSRKTHIALWTNE
jgi:sialic acid synthase SpsE/mannose-6-phosphate isomerase-like protein (cupin superfamily)